MIVARTAYGPSVLQVAGRMRIDMLAGPSELLILADDSGEPVADTGLKVGKGVIQGQLGKERCILPAQSTPLSTPGGDCCRSAGTGRARKPAPFSMWHILCISQLQRGLSAPPHHPARDIWTQFLLHPSTHASFHTTPSPQWLLSSNRTRSLHRSSSQRTRLFLAECEPSSSSNCAHSRQLRPP